MIKGDIPEARRGRPAARVARRGRERRIFVLDTNVLMHDPTAIFRFEEHDVFIPMIVLEELDAGKKGLSEAARNVRQVSRFLDELMENASKTQIDKGLPLPSSAQVNGHKKKPSGRLFFQTKVLSGGLPATIRILYKSTAIQDHPLSRRSARHADPPARRELRHR